MQRKDDGCGEGERAVLAGGAVACPGFVYGRLAILGSIHSVQLAFISSEKSIAVKLIEAEYVRPQRNEQAAHGETTGSTKPIFLCISVECVRHQVGTQRHNLAKQRQDQRHQNSSRHLLILTRTNNPLLTAVVHKTCPRGLLFSANICLFL